MKSKSVTNLAEATADPLLALSSNDYPQGMALERIRVTYAGLGQNNSPMDSPPPPTLSETEQNDESLLND